MPKDNSLESVLIIGNPIFTCPLLISCNSFLSCKITQLLFYASARFVPIALPIAMLLSSVMVFGKLGENYELIALKSSGISFIRILFPITVFVSIISYSSFLFSNYAMPIANLKNGSMIYDIQKKKPELNIKEGIFYNDIEGFSLKIAKKDADGKTLHDIIIYDHFNCFIK